MACSHSDLQSDISGTHGNDLFPLQGHGCYQAGCVSLP